MAWGADFNGQLGNGAAVTANQPAPVQVIGVGGRGVLSIVVAIAAGYGHSLALRSNGTVVTWGSDTYGQLGNGAAATGDRTFPGLTVGVGGGGLSGVTAIAAGSYHSLALRADGAVVAWGRDSSGQLGNGSVVTADQPAPVFVNDLGNQGPLIWRSAATAPPSPGGPITTASWATEPSPGIGPSRRRSSASGAAAR